MTTELQPRRMIQAEIDNDPGFMNLTGKRKGMLQVIGYAGPGKTGARWVVRCDCGAIEVRKTKVLQQDHPNDRCAACDPKAREAQQ